MKMNKRAITAIIYICLLIALYGIKLIFIPFFMEFINNTFNKLFFLPFLINHLYSISFNFQYMIGETEELSTETSLTQDNTTFKTVFNAIDRGKSCHDGSIPVNNITEEAKLKLISSGLLTESDSSISRSIYLKEVIDWEKARGSHLNEVFSRREISYIVQTYRTTINPHLIGDLIRINGYDFSFRELTEYSQYALLRMQSDNNFKEYLSKNPESILSFHAQVEASKSVPALLSRRGSY